MSMSETNFAASGSLNSKLWSKTKPFEHVPWQFPSQTEGTIRFLGPTKDGKDAMLNFKKGEEDQTNLGPCLEKRVTVTDLRHFEPQTTLASEGIQWTCRPSALSEDKLSGTPVEVKEFISGTYYDECAELVKEITGAARAIAYHYRHRRIEEDTNIHDTHNMSTKPVTYFHVDNDDRTATESLRSVLGDTEADSVLSHNKRWGIVNVWRPIGDVVKQWPLALASSRGCETAPIYTRNNYKSHFTALKHSPHLCFYYVSNLKPDEALLFVNYYSGGKDTPALRIAHGAFEDHNAPEGVPGRRSIEVRCLVLYED
ncbi:hypothetical protein QQS21_009294 [Conoideocrella luteorostrata]|uniref:Methyltransferase n=1 Tax=Conoideocrella luteorostrata TaxID=1105319 RepID=A0AAJ0CHD7_9HYPO|nr:hypothetical protein QQS21_009294 [Conoideocrella luteorostrata]